MKTVVCRGIDEQGGDINVEIRLIGRFLHLLRGHEDHGGVVVPKKEMGDTGWNFTSTGWYKILAVSPDCRLFTKDEIGAWTWIPGGNGAGNCYKVGPGEVMVREDWYEKPGGPKPYVLRK